MRVNYHGVKGESWLPYSVLVKAKHPLSEILLLSAVVLFAWKEKAKTLEKNMQIVLSELYLFFLNNFL